MIKLVILSERCKACGLCVAYCPQQLLQESPAYNEAGHHPVAQLEPEKCTGCGICALVCPDVCFRIYRVSDQPAAGSEGGAEEVAP